MRLGKETLLLNVVTDRTWLGDNSLSAQVEKALKAGATIVQLREKNLSHSEFVKAAVEMKAITDKFGIPLIINDNVDIAAAVDADGVHVGQGDTAIGTVRAKLGPDKIIGVTAHNVEEAIQAEKGGADYLGAGAVFNTSTKSGTKSLSFETLKAICNAVQIPVVAIGGITKDNILLLSGSGISGVAVISAVFAQPDIVAATSELRQLSKLVVQYNSVDKSES